MKPFVALDLDELIYPFMEHFVPFANEKFGWAYSMDDYSSFYFEEIWGTDRDFAVRASEQFFAEMEKHPEPIEGASAAISKLADTFKLAVVTSRTDAMHQVTLDWIETHFAQTFVEVQLTNSYVTDGRITKRRKVDVCKELGAIALVDDNLDHILEAANSGVKGVLFGDFAWNQAATLPDRVVRAANWDDVVSILTELT